jgi:pantoate--beta-alanine ligase
MDKWLSEPFNQSKTIAFVPTMGALHDGHLSLIEAANEKANLTIASIFVNPKQFDNEEDLVKYPRQEAEDNHKLEQAGCDAVYLPSPEDLYDSNYSQVELDLEHLENIYEGEKREGHFEGVVQVLYQLFDCIQPNHVMFGQKDYQQCMVVKRLLETYFPDTQLHKVPTFRDSEGLALSSRNQRLSDKGIETAREFNKGLDIAIAQFNEENPLEALKAGKKHMQQMGIDVEYIDFADASNLNPCASWTNTPDEIVIVAACFVQGIRLIDNKVFSLK